MENSDFLGEGWQFPVNSKNKKLSASEGKQNIEESILIILRTSKGERAMRPDFGCEISELLFSHQGSATTTMVSYYVQQALEQWEPRIEVSSVKAVFDQEKNDVLNINIDYKIKSTNTKENLVYPFYLEGNN